MLQEIERCVSNGDSFAFETTLSGLGYLKHIRDWRKLGYHVSLFYLKLTTVEMAIERVASRVIQGGHDIPENVIRRRFSASLRNFSGMYIKEVDSWALFDNSGKVLQLLEWGEIT